ncbi:hypothetical protein HK101_005742 [Irineochytrium annulatum]|nr:hypothetical protein HK101_005742 [Irineochytrium annulatum]
MSYPSLRGKERPRRPPPSTATSFSDDRGIAAEDLEAFLRGTIANALKKTTRVLLQDAEEEDNDDEAMSPTSSRSSSGSSRLGSSSASAHSTRGPRRASGRGGSPTSGVAASWSGPWGSYIPFKHPVGPSYRACSKANTGMSKAKRQQRHHLAARPPRTAHPSHAGLRAWTDIILDGHDGNLRVTDEMKMWVDEFLGRRRVTEVDMMPPILGVRKGGGHVRVRGVPGRLATMFRREFCSQFGMQK